MRSLKNTISFIAVFCVVPAVLAATARPGIIRTNVGARMPTMTAAINSLTGTTNTTTTSALLADTECIDAYTQCMKASDVCGPNFEECTTNVLFHGKMPNCLSTLYQCSTAGITNLFGTGVVSALGTVATSNTYGEVTKYTYPTDGSVMGQMITGAAISNSYDTSTCVRRYTSCLRKDSVCGNDFELCTTNTEFRKQRVACDSTLARCQSAGKIELFGNESNASTATPTATSRVGELITAGAELAAVNSVSTCYKVVDQCILGACTANPYRCITGSSNETATAADEVNDVPVANNNSTDTITATNVRAYISNACKGTIGANKYCYATVNDGRMPTASQLADEDNQDDVFDNLYSARMNDGMRAQLTDIMNKFDTKAKQKCTDTISSCVMRTCGGGLGSACYAAVFAGTDRTLHTINRPGVYEGLQTGCAAIVNTDANCKYAATNPTAAGTYNYSYIQQNAFDTLFPSTDADSTNSDPIGVIAALNARLANNYSDAALAQMKKSCENVAKSCVKSMCGTDYVNCYRNRTDITSNLTNSGDSSFDRSMNKVGGVLDYTIVLGLCLDTVKNASSCDEHLKAEIAKASTQNVPFQSETWGSVSNTRDGWVGAGAATSVERKTTDVVIGCTATSFTSPGATNNAMANLGTINNPDALSLLCNTDIQPCGTVDEDGCLYDQEVTQSQTEYFQDQGARSLFANLLYDIEKEVQAKYNAKLTKQQNMCMDGNSTGGIMGTRDIGGTYMWAKLRSNKIPKNYATAGLTERQFVASNDLYGSFCRIRVNIQSDDKDIQDMLRKTSTNWGTAYFVAGDAFTCGSWIPSSVLDNISKTVAEKKTGKTADKLTTGQKWAVAGATILGGAGGVTAMDLLQTKTGLGGLLKTTDNTSKSAGKKAGACMGKVNAEIQKWNEWKNTNNKSRTSGANPCYCGFTGLSDSTLLAIESGTALYAKNVSGSASESKGDNCEDTNAACLKEEEINTHINNLGSKKNSVCGVGSEMTDNVWSKGLGRAVMDVTGAAAIAIPVGIGTAQALKAKNAKDLSDAQKEWLDEVGSHIQCYIGGDEVGSYGDVISTSLE